MEKIKKVIEKCLESNPCEVDIRYNESMKEHTTFKVGGTADCWISPHGEGFQSFCIDLLNRTYTEKIPVFILGGGANIVVSDDGIRGIVLNMNTWNGESVWTLCAEEDEIIFKSGTSIDEAADRAVAAGLSGLEFLAGMPGTIGGAVWMNARCYGSEIADFLSWAEVVTNEECGVTSVECGVFNEECLVRNEELKNGEFSVKRVFNRGEGFGYKKSPFQSMDCLILSAAFKLKKGDKDKMLVKMEKNREDRNAKGHYDFPCAGSAFLNNREFGKPTGQIIDELGLKGFKKGGAQIAPFHGNIVINTGNATAADIRGLMDEVAKKVKAATGFILEPEILFI
ncbi:MAG: FAD-binding protein [Treponema sp.]|nr:FAD-binding protein [Treponema sp.]